MNKHNVSKHSDIAGFGGGESANVQPRLLLLAALQLILDDAVEGLLNRLHARAQGRPVISRHITQRTLNPSLLSQTARYDVGCGEQYLPGEERRSAISARRRETVTPLSHMIVVVYSPALPKHSSCLPNMIVPYPRCDWRTPPPGSSARPAPPRTSPKRRARWLREYTVRWRRRRGRRCGGRMGTGAPSANSRMKEDEGKEEKQREEKVEGANV